MLKKRAAGVLLHITSLPSRFGVGDFGPAARKFADFLKKAGMHTWQILPLNITAAEKDFSPYSCFSAFAGNPLLISPEVLVQWGLLQHSEIQKVPSFPADRADFSKAAALKYRLYELAYERFLMEKMTEEYEIFLREKAFWLDDFSLFMALKNKYKSSNWATWPLALKNRNPNALRQVRADLHEEIQYQCFLQFVFAKQYFQLKRYCNENGIQIFGDLPIYVTYDSADAWSHPKLFKLDRAKKPKFIAGVPPDYFSETGQLWGNPVYDWDRHAETGYDWWMQRMGYNLALYDIVRIDHFRGFQAFWQVPAPHRTAIKGKWVKGPADEFFLALLNRFAQPSIVVEDLGFITPAVRELIAKFNFPVMKVLQFAFDGRYTRNPHIPHNQVENSVVYTGTHDNNTTVGWFQKELNACQKKILENYIGKKLNSKNIHEELIRLALSSIAKLAVIPMQDILGLSAKDRMNNPASPYQNWKWRMKPDVINTALAKKLLALNEQYARWKNPAEPPPKEWFI